MPHRPPNAFIRQLPKAELHLHLEGAVEPATLLELRRQHGERPTLSEVQALYGYTDFQSFLMAFKAVSAHLRGPDDYELITYRLMQRLKEETVLHAEVYVAVGVSLFRKQDFAAIFEGLKRGRTGRSGKARFYAAVSLPGSSMPLATSERKKRKKFSNSPLATGIAMWLASALAVTK